MLFKILFKILTADWNVKSKCKKKSSKNFYKTFLYLLRDISRGYISTNNQMTCAQAFNINNPVCF